jgi:hypothetical protein
MRYGTPLSYSTSWTPWSFSAAPLIGHEREPSYHFAALDATSDIVRWDVHADQARERYAPTYIDSLVDLDAQFGMFRRGDSALIVAVYADSSHADDAALGIMDFTSVAVAHRDSSDGTRVRMTRSSWKGLVVGVERYDPRKRHAHRARRWLAPPIAAPGAPEISTLFFYNGADTSAVTSLRDAIGRAVTSDVLSGTRKLGVYWEVYDAGARAGADAPAADGGETDVVVATVRSVDDSSRVVSLDTTMADSLLPEPAAVARAAQDTAVAVALTVTRMDGGGIRKWLAQALRISPKDSPLAIGWHDVPGGEGVSYRSVVLDLAQLPAGIYRVELAIGGTTTVREIQIR